MRLVVVCAAVGTSSVPERKAAAVGYETTTLPRTVESPRAARAFVSTALEVGGVPSLIPDAELLVSELVTNAVVHTDSSSIQVQVRTESDGRVRCTVVDEAPDVAPQVQPVDHTRVGGSGLKIVETVAARWGCDRDGSVKAVWFELEPA